MPSFLGVGKLTLKTPCSKGGLRGGGVMAYPVCKGEKNEESVKALSLRVEGSVSSRGDKLHNHL